MINKGRVLWRKCKWGDLAVLVYGKALRDYDKTNGSYPVYGTNGQIGWHTQPLCDKPGIIIGRKGAYRGVHYSDKPFFVIDTAFYLKPTNQSFDIKWAYYQLLNFNINNLDSGSAIPSTSREAFYEIAVDLPSLESQRKIASILSAYDDLIENNARRIKILEEMAQALYREWFVKFRFPGHEKVKMVESELGMVPEGWEVKRLGDVVTLHRGKSYRTSDLVDEGGIPFLNLKCIERGGGFRYDGIKRFQGEFKPTQTAKTGDIVVAVTDMTQERRLVAHAARVHVIGNDFAVMSMDLVKVEPNADVAKDYLHGLLRFSNFSQEVRQHANGVNVLHLNPSQIQEFKFALPPTELRNRYAELCSGAYRECDVLHAKNSNLRRTRDLLLPKLISGEVDVEKIDVRMPNNGGG